MPSHQGAAREQPPLATPSPPSLPPCHLALYRHLAPQVLVYFKETQTRPEGQIHFFPIIFNGKASAGQLAHAHAGWRDGAPCGQAQGLDAGCKRVLAPPAGSAHLRLPPTAGNPPR